MVRVAFHPDFEKLFFKLDKTIAEKIWKQIEKLKLDPDAGQPMRFIRKGTRELYIAPYRLSYLYLKEENKIILADLYHKDEQ